MADSKGRSRAERDRIRQRRLAKAKSTDKVIHIMHGGEVFCGKPGPPNQWTDEHVWVPLTGAHVANCPSCQQRFADLQATEVTLQPNMKMLPAAPGACAVCFTEHKPNMPHNFWSLTYQMRFNLKWKREPTHADTLEHLRRDMGEERFARFTRHWTQVLRERGKEFTQPPEGEQAIAEPYATQ